MEHSRAIDSMAAERYILGELDPEERDAFEEHFFDCIECSTAVRDAAKVEVGIRTPHKRAIARRPPHQRWWAAGAVAATLAVGLIALKPPNPTEHPMKRLGHQIVLEPASRGLSESISFRRDEAIPLTIVIPPEEPQPEYICDVRDDAGHSLASLRVAQAEAKDPVAIVFEPGALRSGKYKVVIRGGDREIAVYLFTVEVR